MSAHTPALPGHAAHEPRPLPRRAGLRAGAAWMAGLLVTAAIVLAGYLERQHQAALDAAQQSLALAARVAADDYAALRQAGATSRDADRQHVLDRIRALTGKEAAFFDEGATRVPSREQGEGVYRVDGADGAARLAVSVPIPDGRLVLSAAADDLLGAYHLLRRQALLGFAAGVAMLAAGAVLFARYRRRRDAYEEAILQRETALSLQRTQLAEAQRIAKLGHFYWDLASDRLTVHSGDESLYGPDPAVHFRTMTEWQERFCHPDEVEAANANQRQNIARGQPYRVQRRTLSPGGGERWLEVDAEPVKDAAGAVVAYRGAFRDITAQKSAEQRLKDSEATFRLISENMHEQVAVFETDGTLRFASRSTGRLLGYDAQHSIGRSPFKNMHPDDAPAVREAIAALAAGAGGPVTLEYRYRHRQGHFVWLESVVVPVSGPDGQVGRLQATTRDVTARRDAEERLRRSEERFRALTEISSDWYWETDVQHRFSFLSVERTVLTRTRRDDILGRTRWEIHPRALSPEEWREHRATLDAHRPFQGLVTRVYDPGGREPTGYFSLSGRPMFSAEGVFLGYRGVGRDITRLKVGERQLAESEERYRLITQNMRDVISLHSATGKLLYVSPSFGAVTGHDIWAVVGVSARHLLHPEDAPAVRRAFMRLAAGEERVSTLAYRLRHRDGRYLWLESHLTLVRDPRGTFRHVQVTSRDVSARREAEGEVVQKSAELAATNVRLANEVRERESLERNILLTIERELAQVGLELHDELGQDLTGIALLSKTLERRLASRNSQDAEEAARISDLVNRTIRHTRMISHGLSPYIWGTDGLADALAQLASDIQSLGVVNCRTRISPDAGINDEMVARSLYRIAQESVNNALKHSHAQHITLSLLEHRGNIHLIISDDGAGGATPEGLADQGGMRGIEAGSRFHSIRHRCRAIGAALAIRRRRRGGTLVSVRWSPQQPAAHEAAPEGRTQ